MANDLRLMAQVAIILAGGILSFVIILLCSGLLYYSFLCLELLLVSSPITFFQNWATCLAGSIMLTAFLAITGVYGYIWNDRRKRHMRRKTDKVQS